jgi:hypothetical protein
VRRPPRSRRSKNSGTATGNSISWIGMASRRSREPCRTSAPASRGERLRSKSARAPVTLPRWSPDTNSEACATTTVLPQPWCGLRAGTHSGPGWRHLIDHTGLYNNQVILSRTSASRAKEIWICLADIPQTVEHYRFDSYHGKTPSYRWRNEGIVPGFKTVRISCRLERHDRFVGM